MAVARERAEGTGDPGRSIREQAEIIVPVHLLIPRNFSKTTMDLRLSKAFPVVIVCCGFHQTFGFYGLTNPAEQM